MNPAVLIIGFIFDVLIRGNGYQILKIDDSFIISPKLGICLTYSKIRLDSIP